MKYKSRILIIILLLVSMIKVVDAQWVQTSLGDYNYIEALATSGSNVYAGTNEGLYLSTNNGNTWNLVLADIACESFAFTRNKIYAGTNNGLFFSTNNGSSWVSSNNNGLPPNIIRALAVKGNNIYAGFWGGDGIYLSTNNGDNWDTVNTGLSEYGAYLNVLATSGNSIFACTCDGIFRSINNGSSWMAINNGMLAHNITSIEIVGNNIFVTTVGYGVYLSTNNGDTWTPYGLSISTDGEAIAVYNYAIFVGTGSFGNYYKNDVFFSTDNGSNWNGSNLNMNSITTLRIGGEYIFAGTSGHGVWRRPLSDFGIYSGINEEINTNISIYPNPTSNTLTIETNSNTKQSFEITNLLGQSLYSSYINKKATVDVSNFAKGVYIIKINTDKETIVKKFIKQ